MIKKLFAIFFAVFFVFNFFVGKINASEPELLIPTETFQKAVVTQIKTTGTTYTENSELPYQDLEIKVLDGTDKDKVFVISYGKETAITRNQMLAVGDNIVIIKTQIGGDVSYQIIDRYRSTTVIPIILVFFAVVVVLSRWKGLGSIIGMIISLGVILQYIVPQILNGQNPLLVSVVGSFMIMVTTIYLAHGFSAKTTIAVVSTSITLVAIGILSKYFVDIVFLSGMGNDQAVTLRFGTTAGIDLKGLLLGGILIGALGVLDDITTGMTATVFEIHSANPKLKFSELFASSLNVGKEHISSLVNTLVLAYAGSGLPIFLMIYMNLDKYPLWFILNDELIMEEVVRTLTGSMGLIMAVPLTAAISAWWVKRKEFS